MAEHTREQSAAWNASRFQIPKESVWQLRRDKLLSGLACGDESAVVFHAGAGFGKTTVMAEWASEHRAQSCWYRLHESDNQFGCFLRGIAAALSCLVNRTLSDAHFSDIGFLGADRWNADMHKTEAKEASEQAGEAFFARCLPALPLEPIFICLDDFHLIHNETVLDFLLRFMEYAEGRARFFFATKCGFPAFLAANLMRGRACEVLEDELRFEERETAHLLKSISGRELPERVVKEIHADMHGWPAGVAFAGIDLKNMRASSAERANAEGAPEGAWLFDRTHLYQYLFYEIFRKLAFDTQRFLTESSVMEKIRPALCDHALGRSDSAGMLRYLVREHLFLTPFDGEDDTYIYEGVWGGFLRSRLSGGRRMEILLKAAQYHVRCGEWEEAVRYAMECGEKGCGVAAAVLEKRAAAMRAAGQQALLRTWIDHLYRFREQLTDTALFCMYEYLYRDGERQRGKELLAAAAKRAYAKLRYDRYERYMCELAEVTETEYGRDAADQVETEARQMLAVRGIAMSGRAPRRQEDTKRDAQGDAGRDAQGDASNSAKDVVQSDAQGERASHSGAFVFVQCLRSFSVRGPAGEVVWRTKKTKELFACLFYEGGRWTARDVLMERLWPDKEADKAAVLFHTTASYLRKALAVVDTPECLLVRNQSYALDMARLDSDIGRLCGCFSRMKKGEELSKEDASQMMALYGQGFLYEEDYVWAEAYREQVQQRFLWMLRTLAKQYMEREGYGDAAALLKKATELDDYALDVMEQTVECLIRCRDIAGAKRAYQRLTRASLEVLDEKPERTFEEIVRDCGKG